MRGYCLTIKTAFFLMICMYTGHAFCFVQCHVAAPHKPSDADTARMHGNDEKAEKLYRQMLQQDPNNVESTGGLVRTLLEEQKLSDAQDTIDAALQKTPQSVPLLTALGEVQFRKGEIEDAGRTTNKAMALDPCYPMLRLLSTRLFQLRSMYASAQSQIETAHKLDPYDPEIRELWTDSLPLKERIEELKNYLANAGDLSPELSKQAKFQLAYLEDRAANPGKSCHLASAVSSTDIPFAALMSDATHVAAWGLEVRFNNKNARLELDTGASGLYISRSVAERAGLKPAVKSETYGIGDKGPQSGYTAYVDSIRIGNLEFRDCLVDVSDRGNVINRDGLIGTDVFSNFLVTLDFPWRKLRLAPLPQRPGEESAPVTLATQETTQQDSSAGANSQAEAKPDKTKVVSHGPYDRYVAPEMKDYSPVYRIGHDMIVPTMLNNKTVRLFIVDTGAFRTAVSPAAAREVTKVSSDADMHVKGISGSVDHVYSGDKVIVQFAHLRQEIDDIVSFDNTNISDGLGTEISGFLGIDLLHFLTISIDYRDGLMKFDYAADRGYQHLR
jgi:predicted aspartyl protease